MKNFLLLCIVWCFTAFTGIAFAFPPPPPPSHHMHCSHSVSAGHSYYRPANVHYNQSRTHTTTYNRNRYGTYSSSHRRYHTSPYRVSRCYTNTYDRNYNRQRNFMPTHTTPFYGF